MTRFTATRVLTAWAIVLVGAPVAADALRRHVTADDPAYRWEHVAQTRPQEGLAVHELRLISQVWQGIAWRHRLRLITPQPPQGPPPLALLLVTGTGAGEQEGRGALFMARALRAPVALLYVANTGPTLQAGREQATAGLMALVQHAAGRLRLPTLHWEASAAGDTLTLARPSDRPPRSVRAWVATAPTRDLRDARGEAFEMPAEHDRYVHRRPLRRGHITAVLRAADYTADPGPFFSSTAVRLFP